MAEQSRRIFGAPGTYIQGPGALGSSGAHLARLGDRVFGLLDVNVWGTVQPILAEACQVEGLAWHVEPFSGECTDAAAEKYEELARSWSATAILAAGGGKTLDTGKLVAEALSLPAAMAPTIASTDAPTSRVAVVYTEDHELSRVARLRRNPALVLVDTAVVLRAPLRFLVSGMGDALSTWPEARANANGAARTPLGGGQTRAAMALAQLSYRLVLDFGRDAVASVRAGELTPAFEAVVEANVLLSGLGFENGGLAACHALHAGLSAIPACRNYLHGEMVAFGVVVQSVLENWRDEERDELLEFFADVGLPATLAEVGLAEASMDELERIAEVTCRPGAHIHKMKQGVTVAQLMEVLKSLRRGDAHRSS